MCHACLKRHGDTEHLREKYIERMALKLDERFPKVDFPPVAGYRPSMLMAFSGTLEEFEEACLLISQWRETDKLG